MIAATEVNEIYMIQKIPETWRNASPETREEALVSLREQVCQASKVEPRLTADAANGIRNSASGLALRIPTGTEIRDPDQRRLSNGSDGGPWHFSQGGLPSSK